LTNILATLHNLTQDYVHCLTTAMAHFDWVLSVFRKWPKFQCPLSVA